MELSRIVTAFKPSPAVHLRSPLKRNQVANPRIARLFAAFATLAIGVGCGDDRQPLTPIAPAFFGNASDPGPFIARGIARALADSGLRMRLLTDLASSPFPKKRIHLLSYLRGGGQPLAVAAAVALNVSPDELLGDERLTGYQLIVPRSLDRVRWTGTNDLVVVGTDRSLRARAVTGLDFGFSTTGQPVNVPFWTKPQYPVLEISITDVAFPADPEAVRLAAGTVVQPTVSTREAELSAMMGDGTECDPSDPTLVIECPGGPVQGGVPTGIRTVPFPECVNPAAGSDADNDGLDDQCEFALALAFRPRLAFTPDDCDTTREPHWSANRHQTQTRWIRIFYAISYRRDCGYFGGWSHQGDSEFIILEVSSMSSDSLWVLEYATLSAHWQSSGDETSTYRFDALQYPETYRGRPRIWVAKGKHANYRSKSVCDAGAYYADTCDGGSDTGETVEMMELWNLGNSWYPAGSTRRTDCVGSRLGGPGMECFWTANSFRGWLTPSGDGSTPYGQSLWFFYF